MARTPDKHALRQRFRAYRTSLDAVSYARHSHAVVTRLRAVPELSEARTVHTYWPMTANKEIDLRPWIEERHAAGVRIVLPVVVAFRRTGSGAPRLRHVRFDGIDTLRRNPWGIDEPMNGASVPLDEVDVIIVPALGAGRNGHRVGHGYGYYDELLTQTRAPAVCPVYAACLVDRVPADAHDVPMSVLVTEDVILRPTLPA